MQQPDKNDAIVVILLHLGNKNRAICRTPSASNFLAYKPLIVATCPILSKRLDYLDYGQ